MLGFIGGARLLQSPTRGQKWGDTAWKRGCGEFKAVEVTSRERQRCRRCRSVRTVQMGFADPWSVPSAEVATQLFAVSLFPYLAFLRDIGRKEVDCPRLAVSGFQFLLVFVVATIPAGIYAKVHYHDILANVDWLHGCAESMLTVTNLLILLGFKSALRAEAGSGAEQTQAKWGVNAAVIGASCLLAIACSQLGLEVSAPHAQPANALSTATWVIHISSLIEWLGAMDLVWDRARRTGNERWKSLTWGMVPLHTSGLLACTYHFFYNAPSLDVMVAMQAALTAAGNATMWWGASRIYSEAKTQQNGSGSSTRSALAGSTSSASRATSSSTDDIVQRSTVGELTKVTVISILAAVGLRYGTLYIDLPFQPSLTAAMAIVLTPTALNITKWYLRSQST
eukprot:Plantae.Rhodophyta-Purpureofilum_apyrenoidigerum.ctg16063.p1 GENE.Plantae.Rhodophyta-Purpureofilum_apyrenoidigerum.ctg16063~~Plantae.Rhodophyta-Purpureofilum_apyrenoidigerum.ctg16063.p1  ORF type:complete len:396 (-),score=21.08 Plantae.Rhodophyta-Purpureofilum_apyrenoidigerum.ctg16063:361-1548(-)